MQVQLGTILAPRSNKRMHTADDATEEEGARAAGPAEARADAMRHVMGYLGPRGLGHVACASRQTRRLTEDERVWKALCYSDLRWGSTRGTTDPLRLRGVLPSRLAPNPTSTVPKPSRLEMYPGTS